MSKVDHGNRIDRVSLFLVIFTVLLMSVAAFGVIIEGLGRVYQGHAAYQRNSTVARDAATMEIENVCLKGELEFQKSCLSEKIAAFYHNQATNEDLKAQQEMAYWAMLLLFSSVFQIAISAFGIYFIRESLKTSQQAVLAAFHANRLAEEERAPLIEIVGAKASRARITRLGAELEISIEMQNIGGSVARGFRVDVRYAQPTRFQIESFIQDCAGLTRDPRRIAFREKSFTERLEVKIGRREYDTWLHDNLSPYEQMLKAIHERAEATMAKYGRDHNDKGEASGEMQRRKEMEETILRWNGIGFHFYAIATWNSVDARTVNFACQEFKAHVAVDEGQGGDRMGIPMEKDGPLNVVFIPVGSQLVG